LRRACTDEFCTSAVPHQFDLLTEQAMSEQDQKARKALYSQAEQILSEVDAAYLPLYFYSNVEAAKPYLERTYPPSVPADIAGWRITRVTETIDPAEGGGLVSYDSTTTLQFPGGAFTDTVHLSQAPAYPPWPGSDLADLGITFDITGVYSNTGGSAALAPGMSYTTTITYDESALGVVPESSVSLYYWTGSQWLPEPTSSVDSEANTITANPSHFSIWSVLGETERIYLPNLSH
jgi:hypothetical protein